MVQPLMLLILNSKKEVSERTSAFFELLGKHLSKSETEFLISSFPEIEVFIEKEKTNILINGNPLEKFSTVYPRKVGNYSGLTFILAHCCKKNGSNFIDRFREVSNDLTKLIQTFLFSFHGIPTPRTYFSAVYEEAHLDHAIRFLQFPIIVKQCNTSKGSGVALATNKEHLQRKIDTFRKESPGKEIILQEYIENFFEYRIFVTGDTIATAEKKTRMAAGEFRNNVHLGAKEEFLDPRSIPESLKKMALRVAEITNIQIAGIDIVEDANGNWYVFEANSCPGFTLDETVSNEVQKLSEYLALCEKK